MIAASVAELLLIPTLAARGILMTAISPMLVLCVFAAAVVLAFALDQVKVIIFSRLRIV